MKNAYLGNYTSVGTTKFGRKIYVDTRDNSLAPHILLEGEWEGWTTDYIRKMMAGCTFVDVGANFGWFSLWAYHNNASRVIAVEANPEVADLLTRTFAVNGMLFGTNNKVYSRAVSDKSGEELKLIVDRHYLGSSSAILNLDMVDEAEDFNNVEYPYNRHPEIKTTTIRLDDFLEGEKNLFIKIDVEGLEPEAIAGCQKTIESAESVQLLIEHNAVPKQEWMIRYLLEEQRFKMRHLDKSGEARSIKKEDLANIEAGDMLYFYKLS